MKRALIASLVVLELALVALVWWASTRARPRDSAPVAQPEHEAAERASEPVPELERQEREAVQPSMTRDEAQPTITRRRLPPRPPEEDPFADAELHGLVVFKDTGLPVSGGTVDAAFLVEPNLEIDEHTILSSRRKRPDAGLAPRYQFLHGAEIHPDGRFVLKIASEARVQSVSVSGLARSEAPAGKNYLPCEVKLEKALSELGPLLRVEVVRGFEITGLVLDAASGAPVAGARVDTAENWSLPEHASTDSHGRFVLAGMGLRDPNLVASMICSHDEFLRTELEFTPAVLRDNGPQLVLKARHGNSLSGTLLDQHDQPLWGVEVRLVLDEPAYLESERPEREPRCERTGLRGEFRFSPMPACAGVTLTIEDQSVSGMAVFRERIPLGALRADRSDVVLRATTGVTLSVNAELADGSRLAPRGFTLVCPAEGRARVLSRAVVAQRVIVPLHEPVEIVAFAQAESKEVRNAFVRGTGRVFFDREPQAPQSLTIVLDETGHFEIPPPPSGTATLELGGPEYLQGALDVQLLDDATGEVLQGGREVLLACGPAGTRAAGFLSGWVRLVGQPGKYSLRVQIAHVADDTLELTIPASGYSKRTARVRTGL